MMTPSALTKVGIQALRKGDTAKAYELLAEAVTYDPNDALGWFWLSACYDELDYKIYCLRKAVFLDSSLDQARTQLQELETTGQDSPALYISEDIPQFHEAIAQERLQKLRRSSMPLMGMAILLLIFLAIGMRTPGGLAAQDSDFTQSQIGAASQTGLMENLLPRDRATMPRGNLDPLFKPPAIIDRQLPAPIIQQVRVISTIEQDALVSGWSFQMVSRVTGEPARVRLYEVQLRGCKDGVQQFEGYRRLGEVQVGEGAPAWQVDIHAEPRMVVAATTYIDGEESGWSNLLALDKMSLALNITNSGVLAGKNFEIQSGLGVIDLSGSGLPGSCLQIKTQSPTEWTGQISVDSAGRWQLQNLLIHQGNNPIEISSMTMKENPQPVRLNVWGGIEIVWPFGEGNERDYHPDLTIGSIVAWFGMNDYHALWYPGGHDGIDIAGVDLGTPVHAVADGCVFKARDTWWTGGGRTIMIDHGSWATIYYHLNSIETMLLGASNDTPICIKRGQIIGYVGNTGTYMVHLHITAFRWAYGNRIDTFKDPYYWRDLAGEAININPPKGKILWDNVSSNVLGPFAGAADYWNLDWSRVPITWYCGYGTSFSNQGVAGFPCDNP